MLLDCLIPPEAAHPHHVREQQEPTRQLHRRPAHSDLKLIGRRRAPREIVRPGEAGRELCQPFQIGTGARPQARPLIR